MDENESCFFQLLIQTIHYNYLGYFPYLNLCLWATSEGMIGLLPGDGAVVMTTLKKKNYVP